MISNDLTKKNPQAEFLYKQSTIYIKSTLPMNIKKSYFKLLNHSFQSQLNKEVNATAMTFIITTKSKPTRYIMRERGKTITRA